MRSKDVERGVAGGERGRAFTIDDALLALRWAGLVRRLGFRVRVALDDRDADEVIELRFGAYARPVARISRARRTICLTDCAGQSRFFATLADALACAVPLSPGERQAVLRPDRPDWLWRPATPAGGFWRQLLRRRPPRI